MKNFYIWGNYCGKGASNGSENKNKMANDNDINDRYKRLIDRYGSLINKVCYMYAESVEDFDDLRQETFINLWRGMESFRGDAELTTWVYRVTLNSCVSYFRKNRKIKSTPLDSLPEQASDDTDRNKQINELHGLINRLDRVEKALILLWLDEYPYETIAEILGMPRNTVASRLHRVKEKLIRYSNQ